MTATATTELDVLDFEAAPSGASGERAVGDLQLAEWDRVTLAGVLSLHLARHAERDLVMVAIEDDHGGRFALPERVVKRTLTLPRAVLVAAGCDANIPACLVLEQDQPLVGVLLMVLDEVWNRLPAMSDWEVEATGGALVTLIAAVVGAENRSVTPRPGLPALRAQIDDWITGNLDSGPIRIEDLAVAHCVSARTIHRAFSLTGDTMKTVVRAKRLAAVREELVHTDRTIAAIAHRWCYYDPSHLGREFRRHFGVSPSEYRERHGC